MLKNNALLNKIDNAEFVCDDAGKYMVELVKKNIHLDVVFVIHHEKDVQKNS